MKLRYLVLAATALPLALVYPGTASSAPSPPVIQSFTVSSVNSNYEALSTSPLVLYNAGGYVSIAAAVKGGTHCQATIRSKPLLPGLPVKFACGLPASPTIDIPANSGGRSVSYTLSLRAAKPGTVKAVPIVVSVSTTPPPSSVPGVVPGSEWEATPSDCPASDPPSVSSFDEVFNANGTVSSSFPGYYEVAGDQLTQTLVIGETPGPIPIDDQWTLTWNPSEQDYTGMDDILQCSWTLTPVED